MYSLSTISKRDTIVTRKTISRLNKLLLGNLRTNRERVTLPPHNAKLRNNTLFVNQSAFINFSLYVIMSIMSMFTSVIVNILRKDRNLDTRRFCVSSKTSKMKTRELLADLYCSQQLTQGLDKHIICLLVINTILSITAIVGNTLILIALHKEISSLYLPSKALLRNLVASDLCVGFVELIFVAYWVSISQEQWQMCHYFYLAYIIGSYISIQCHCGLWPL